MCSFTSTDRASTIPSSIRGCQSGTILYYTILPGILLIHYTIRGHKEVRRVTRRQCNTLRGMVPINVKTVHQTSFLHIESSPEELGPLSPTHGQRSQQPSGQITNHAPISFDRQTQVSQGHTSCRKKEICSSEVHGGGLEPVKLARIPASSCPKPCASLKNAPIILALRGKKQSMVRDEPCPQKLPGSRL